MKINIKSVKTITVLCVSVLVIGVATTRASDFLDFFRDWTGNEISSILGKVGDAKDNAGTLKSGTGGVKQVVNTARDSFDALSGDVLDAIDNVRSSTATQLADELALAQDFVGNDNCAQFSPCDNFRNDLLMLLDDLAEIANGLSAVESTTSALAVDLDLSRARQAIEAAPGIALYPIHRAMSVSGDQFLAGVLEVTARVRQDLQLAIAILSPVNPQPQATLASFDTNGIEIPDTCEYVLLVPNVSRAASFSFLSAAVTLKMVGKSLEALGETLVLGGPKEVGVHGYYKLEFHDNKKKKYATYVDGIADVLGKISVAIDNKLIYCAALGNRVDVLAALQSITHPSNRRGK